MARSILSIGIFFDAASLVVIWTSEGHPFNGFMAAALEQWTIRLSRVQDS